MPMVIVLRIPAAGLLDRESVVSANLGHTYSPWAWMAIRKILKRNGYKSADVKNMAYLEL